MAGIRVWRDSRDLWPGQDWRAQIRRAIAEGTVAFLACFSRAGLSRGTRSQNEELALAAEELRRRRLDMPWLIPVRLDDCEIPDLALGGGRTLGQLQRADLFGEQREQETVRLVSVLTSMLRPGEARDQPAGAPGAITTAGFLAGAPATRAAPLLRFSLPPDTAAFTGRDEELDAITAGLAGAARAGGVVTLRAIGGMPGAGKTALAVHVAHKLASRFPDRQLFIDLHAHTPGRDPVRPEDALAGLLAATGVDPQFLPGDLDRLMAMWRDRLARQRALLVLDNASGSGQVTPLLPGGGDCLVLVTSRRHLGDLPGLVVPVLLDVLPAVQAEQMFVRLAPRAAQDPAGVAEVVRLAGFLPLAVSLLASVFARHGSWSLADLAAETREHLLSLTAENDSVAAAFEVSYRHLDHVQRRFFRLLGLQPGTATDAYAAAALAGIAPADAASLLDALHGECLLTETGRRRYGMHDLLRRYARDLAATDQGEDRDRSLGRLLDYYQQAAALAQSCLARGTRPGSPPPALTAPPAMPALHDAGQALAWMRADRDSLLACLDHATRAGQHARVIALTAAMAEFLRRDGAWTEAAARHATAVRAARHLGDGPGEASALTDLGIVRQLTGDYPGSADDLDQALAIYRDLGNLLGQASSLMHLGDFRRVTGDYQGAARDLEQALGLYRHVGNISGQAKSLTLLGDVRGHTSDFQGAARDLERSLALSRDLDHGHGQAEALTWLGVVRRVTGDYQGAARNLERALALSHDLGDRRGQADALISLGDVRGHTGDYQRAIRDLEQALALSRDLGYRLGEVNATFFLGVTRRLTGDYQGAARDLEQALTISRAVGSRKGQANALCCRGGLRREIGDYPGAARDLGHALALYRDLGDPGGEVTVLNELGTLHLANGKLARTERYYQQALVLARALASALDEASALAGLGRCAIAAGQPAQAEAPLRQAYEVLRRIGAPEAPFVLAELDVLRRDRRPGGEFMQP